MRLGRPKVTLIVTADERVQLESLARSDEEISQGLRCTRHAGNGEVGGRLI
jgi:hypothetical protein